MVHLIIICILVLHVREMELTSLISQLTDSHEGDIYFSL